MNIKDEYVGVPNVQHFEKKKSVMINLMSEERHPGQAA